MIDVEHELLVPLTLCDLGGGRRDGASDVPLEVAEIQIGFGGGLLDKPEGLDEPTAEALAADREVLEGSLGLRAIEGIGRHPDLAERIALDSKVVGHRVDLRESDPVPLNEARGTDVVRRVRSMFRVRPASRLADSGPNPYEDREMPPPP